MRGRGGKGAAAAAAGSLSSSSSRSLPPTSPSPSSSSSRLSSSSAVAAVRGAAGAAQFTGSYLSRLWARRFILGSLLQRYTPPAAPGPAASATAVDVAVLSAQRRLSDLWQLPAKPLDASSEARILRLLARYACGEGLLSDEALSTLTEAVASLPGAPLPLHDPANVERLLESVGYVAAGDNLRRVAYAGALHYAPQAESLMEPHLRAALRADGGDPLDAIRRRDAGPGYAIDSATTSEVDDAIGTELDEKTGEEYFVVYVADATVFCPFDSPLEQVTARALATTTYLPEGVYFMLPKPIVEAATLREDQPCRTFCVRFQIDMESGELKNYSVHVGWLQQLRRITYDQVQEILDARDGEGDKEGDKDQQQQHPPPSWVGPADVAAMRRIYAAARRRFECRLQRALRHEGRSAVSSSLPDPLIQVRDRAVVSVTDQVICTQDARLAVAELMIAANEACSRVARAEGIPIPFRGTRPLSSDHEAARAYAEPQGVAVLPSLDATHTFVAERMRRTVRELSGVTRAMYAHLPMYHAGLDTTFYTHSTSPLRRYADMLVHHQLKVWLWRKNGGGQQRQHAGFPIPEYAMATLCANISTRQEQAALLQDGSSRYWMLRYIQQQQQQQQQQMGAGGVGGRGRGRTYMCLIGETRRVAASPEYPRCAADPAAATAALLPQGDRKMMQMQMQQQQRAAVRGGGGGGVFVSEVYIPELQLAHCVQHSCEGAVVGAVVECCVVDVRPTQDVLQLAVVRVMQGHGGEARVLEQLLLGGAVANLDS